MLSRRRTELAGRVVAPSPPATSRISRDTTGLSARRYCRPVGERERTRAERQVRAGNGVYGAAGYRSARKRQTGAGRPARAGFILRGTNCCPGTKLLERAVVSAISLTVRHAIFRNTKSANRECLIPTSLGMEKLF